MMDENQEQKVNTEEMKTEAVKTVNQVKDTIKNVDIKKDTAETKGFLGEIFKNPLGKMQEIALKDNGKYLKFALIFIAIWIVAEATKRCFEVYYRWGYFQFGKNMLSILITAITPALVILILSLIIYLMNQKNKKSLSTIITLVTVAKIPVIIASVARILTVLSSQIGIITRPFSTFCSVISVILLYFAAKSIFNVEKNSDFIKKFIAIEGIYYIVYFVLAFLEIYI